MRQHAPETQHRRGSNVDAELRQIDLDMAGNGAGAPGQAVVVRCGQIRARKATTQPEALYGVGVVGKACLAYFGEIETAHLDGFYPAQQRLPGLAQQRRG